MAQPKLGRGLSALLQDEVQKTSGTSETSETTEIDIRLLHPNPWQPRQDFTEENLAELAASIKNQGIIQPLLVRKMPDESYQIIAGERRYRAAKLVGMPRVPVFIRSMSDEDVMVCALIENLQRENLNPLEEAQAIKTLRDTLNLTQEAVAEKIGRSRSSIANALRLLQLSPEAQDDLRSGKLSAGHARALLALPDTDLCESLRSTIIANSLSVRETEELIAQWKKTGTPAWSAVEEKTQPSKPVRPKKSEIAKKMQALISQVMACKTTVSGNEEQGRITISYSSSEELQTILQKLGTEQLNTREINLEKKARPDGAAAADGEETASPYDTDVPQTEEHEAVPDDLPFDPSAEDGDFSEDDLTPEPVEEHVNANVC